MDLLETKFSVEKRAAMGQPQANLSFLLDIFLENVYTKLEKLQRILRARKVLRVKQSATAVSMEVTAFRADAFESIRRLQTQSSKLLEIIQNVESLVTTDILSRELQIAIV